MSNVFSIALSGMHAATARMVNATKNIVNVSSTGSLPADDLETTNAYQPTDVVTHSNNVGDNALGVSTEVVDREPAYYPFRDPTNRDANADGLVAMPNVDLTSELLDVVQAKITYEASAKIISVEQEKQESILDTLA